MDRTVAARLAAAAAPLLTRCTFPAAGSALSCAVSGGRDSLALLALAVASGCEVLACHVDHGLRVGSAREAAAVVEVAQRLGCRAQLVRVEVAPGANLEARARLARRAALPAGYATGHTADDQAETVLIRLLRGSGLDGLAGMRAGPAHPILGLRRAEAAQLVETLGFEPVEDPSNSDPRFVRNRIRHELLPLCSAIAGRDVVPLLERSAALLSDDASSLAALAGTLDATDCLALVSAPRALARRAVREWLRADGPERYPPSAATVERVLAVASGSVRACEIEGGRRVRRSGGRLQLSEPVERLG